MCSMPACGQCVELLRVQSNTLGGVRVQGKQHVTTCWVRGLGRAVGDAYGGVRLGRETFPTPGPWNFVGLGD